MSDNILIINFDAKTKDGMIARNVRYKPSMSSQSLYKDFPNILFIPTIKIKRSDFSFKLGPDDIKKIFLSPTQFKQFVTKLKKREPRRLTLAQAEAKGIIIDNITFILNIFFPKNSLFYLYNNPYVVNSYTWDYQIVERTVPNKRIPQYDIRIKLFLSPGKDMNFIDSSRLTCLQRRQQIVDDWLSLTGQPPRVENMIEPKRSPSLVPQMPGTYSPPRKSQQPKNIPTTQTTHHHYAPQTFTQTYAPTDARSVHLYGPSAPPMPPGGFPPAPPARGLAAPPARGIAAPPAPLPPPPAPAVGGSKTKKRAPYKKRRKTRKQ